MAEARLSSLLPLLLVGLSTAPAAAQDSGAAEERAVAADREARALRREAEEAFGAASEAEARISALAADAQRFEGTATRMEERLAQLSARRAALLEEIGGEQAGVTKLLAALQRLSRRPVAAALLAPGEAVEAARIAALVDTVRPQIARRTAGLRARLDEVRELEAQAARQRAQLAQAENDLSRSIAALEAAAARFRSAGERRTVKADAARERTRRLAARALDLAGLADAVAPQADQRPRRRLRSYRPGPAEVARAGYRAPAAGRILRRFGRANEVGVLQRGVTVATREDALVTAPAPGRVVYAGPFREYRALVILEHERGLVSVMSGLDRADVAEGQRVVRGAPLGRMNDDGELYVELRRRGTPVDPMLYIRGR